MSRPITAFLLFILIVFSAAAQNSVEITGELDTESDIILIDEGNLAAFDIDATDVYDMDFDVYKPSPPPDDYLQIYFPHPEWPAPLGDNFMVDVRNGNDDLINDVKAFYFEVNTDLQGEEVLLTFDIGMLYPPVYGVVLADNAGVYHNLREDNTFVFNAGAVPDVFNLRLGDGTEPVLNITFPFQGTTLSNQTAYDILWSYDDITDPQYTILLYSTDNGGEWTQIDSIPGSPGTYEWITPDVVTEEALIRVISEDWAGNAGQIESDLFTIGGNPPTVIINTPTADELLISGQTYQVTWDADAPNGLEYSLVDYTPDNGVNWSRVDSIAAPETFCGWRVPDIYSTECLLRVTAFDILGYNTTDITGYTFNIGPDSLEIDFDAGWHLISVPLVPQSAAIDSIFGDDIAGTYFVYDFTSAGGFGLINQVHNGEGYWLALFDNTTVDIGGLPEIDSTCLSLDEGWNIIGNSMPVDVDKDDLNIWDGHDLVDFSSAADSGWISYDLYGYDTSISNYIMSDILSAWEGYWLKTALPGLELVTYPPPYAGQTDETNLVSDDADLNRTKGWFVPVKLYGDGISAVISGFGVDQDASDGFDVFYDALLPPCPPSGNYLQVVFDHPEWGTPFGTRFCRDVKSNYIQDNETPESKQWIFTIESSATGPVTVNFERVMDILPEGYSAVAEFDETLINLAENHSFIFDYTEPLDITATVYNEAAAIQGWNGAVTAVNTPDKFAIESIFPNPFNPVTTITFSLPGASEISLVIYNLEGREITELTGGYYPAGIHSIGFDASGLSSGIYFAVLQSDNTTNTLKLLLLK